MASSSVRAFGLRKVAPTSDTVDNTAIDIIAIHGLGTQSPRTWEYKKTEGGVVNWLADSDMLPAAIPEASIFTYDWNASHFENAPVQTLLGHADNLLALVAGNRPSGSRPIIFVASCFGGLILAEAINRAAQAGNPYQQVLLDTVGGLFLATPFRGSDAAEQAKWQVVIGGIMGEQTSMQLVEDLDSKDKELLKLKQVFAELVQKDSIRMPLYCFYETEKSEILRQLLPSNLPKQLSSVLRDRTKKLLVTEQSACLDGVKRQGLNATHSYTNKFNGPESSNYILVKDVIKQFANNASTVLNRRKNRNTPEHQQGQLPVDRNRGPRGGVGKTQIALEAAYRVQDTHKDCSILWVPAVDMISFEKSYREIGRLFGVEGLEDDKSDVVSLIQTKLNHESAGSWLLIIDNADDIQLVKALSDNLPSSRKGSILFTTRNHAMITKLDIPPNNVFEVREMSRDEALEMFRNNVSERQRHDTLSSTKLLNFLADLPLAIKQASAYIFKTGISTKEYLDHCQSNDKTMVKLLSRDFEDRARYKAISNPVATTWLISFNHILRDMPLAARYLRFVCFLAEKDIPVSLLPPGDDELEEKEAIGILKGYGFIIERKGPDNSFDIHRLVRLATRNWIESQGERQQCITNTIQHLSNEFPFPVHENREKWIKYLPHAQVALGAREDCSDEEAKWNLLFIIGESNFVLGKYEEAEEMQRETLELKKKVLDREHPSILGSINNLANVLNSQGKYEEAEEIQRETLYPRGRR